MVGFFFRLQELQKNMVGGEEAKNEEKKERHKKRNKHAEERRKKLQGLCLYHH